ncbi:MAG TPA: ATPase, T2SS/T4P/T4SS family [bacterium]|nr:ATPase, T2SS/T4P/T4SS family [bacterium]
MTDRFRAGDPARPLRPVSPAAGPPVAGDGRLGNSLTPHASSSGGQAKEKPLIGQILLAQGVLSRDQLAKALELQQATGGRLGRILVKMGVVTEGQLARALAQQWKTPPTNVVELADESAEAEQREAATQVIAPEEEAEESAQVITPEAEADESAEAEESDKAMTPEVDIEESPPTLEISEEAEEPAPSPRPNVAAPRTAPHAQGDGRAGGLLMPKLPSVSKTPPAPRTPLPAPRTPPPAPKAPLAPKPPSARLLRDTPLGGRAPSAGPVKEASPGAIPAKRPVKGVSKREPIGEILLAQGILTQEQLTQALEIQRQSGGWLGRILVDMGIVSERQLARTLAQHWGMPYTELSEGDSVDPEASRLVPPYLAQRHGVVAIGRKGNRLMVAMSDPSNVVAIDDIRLLTGLDVEVRIASADDITKAQGSAYGIAMDTEELLRQTVAATADSEVAQDTTQTEDITLERLRTMGEEAPIIRVVNQIISQAVRTGASDIHLEPHMRDMKVRFRVDGLLQDIMSPPKAVQAALISRIKILGNMDIAERRLPQDGAAHVRVEGRHFDLRISTLPTVLGEKVVIRLLDQSSTKTSLNKIGFTSELLAIWEDMISKPYGMIIVTGPTGSGKTTTLYTSLGRINTPERNIVSVEDPVEYQMPRVNQVQVNPKAGVTFANALRSILRQDPNVVLIGEMRDKETAEIGVQASMTGHLVLSTLHTNDAAGAVTRLRDMGIEPFLITASLIAVLAQRLVRVICPQCKEAYTPPAEALRRLGLESGQGVNLYRGKGCDHCRGSGYRGRLGVFELMVMNDNLRSLVLSGAGIDEIREAAIQNGMRTLNQDGVQKVLEGITTFEELLRVVFVNTDSA